MTMRRTSSRMAGRAVALRDVAIVGSAAAPVGRHADVLEHELLLGPLLDVVKEVGIGKADIDALVFCTPRPNTKQRYFGTFMAGYLDLQLDGILVEVLGNGMTGGLAFDAAVDQIASGRADIVIALGVSSETSVPSAEHMEMSMRAVGDVDFHAPLGVTPISWYALNATRYLHDTGHSREELAQVAVKNRRHAALNPLAQYREPISVENVVSARPIVRPLGLLDVAPRSDGAVAVVLAAADIAGDLCDQPVYVTGRGFHHEGVHQVSARPESLNWFRSAERAAEMAYSSAGIGPGDVDVAELYAPCTIVEVILSESLGLVPVGAGIKAALAGDTEIGGRIPISTDGGCLSRGHPPLVSPLYNVHEAVLQLRGAAGGRQVAGARTAITTAELGDYNATLMHVLSIDGNRRRGW